MIEAAPGVEGPAGLLRLMNWLSPNFPVGAFAYSHGLETVIADGWVRDEESLFAWVRTLLVCGSGWNDLVIFAEAHHAHRTGDWARLEAADELCEALAGSSERRSETLGLGRAFAEAVRPWTAENAAVECGCYPVAVASAAAGLEIGLEQALAAFAQGFASNLVVGAVRLVPLGQSVAVSLSRRLEPVILQVAAAAAKSTLDDLGSAAIASEIAAMRHETLSPRIFRT